MADTHTDDLADRPRRFRKRPVVVEAIQYRPHNNCHEVAAFMGIDWHADACGEERSHAPWLIPTLEGVMEANPGDWIIRGVQGEFYPCKPDIFDATYEPVEGT